MREIFRGMKTLNYNDLRKLPFKAHFYPPPKKKLVQVSGSQWRSKMFET